MPRFSASAFATGPRSSALMVTLLITVLRAMPATKPVRPARAPLDNPSTSIGAFTADEVMLTMRPNFRAIMPSTVGLISSIGVSMLASIELIKATVDGMMARKFGRIVNITSSAVKAPIEVLGLSNGARAGLTGFVAGIARKTVINNVTINALLPGPFDTDRLRGPVAKAEAEKRGITVDQLIAERGKNNPAGRVGDPEEFGLACAFLCGAKAGFITGQNILLDGGAFPGTL